MLHSRWYVEWMELRQQARMATIITDALIISDILKQRMEHLKHALDSVARTGVTVGLNKSWYVYVYDWLCTDG